MNRKHAGFKAARYLAGHGGTMKAAAARFGTYHSTVLGYWRRMYGNRPTPLKGQTQDIRDLLLRGSSYFATKSAQDLFHEVRSEWGTVCERRLWRALRWLVERNLVVRVGKRNYEEYGYRRVKQEQRLHA